MRVNLFRLLSLRKGGAWHNNLSLNTLLVNERFSLSRLFVIVKIALISA